MQLGCRVTLSLFFLFTCLFCSNCPTLVWKQSSSRLHHKSNNTRIECTCNGSRIHTNTDRRGQSGRLEASQPQWLDHMRFRLWHSRSLLDFHQTYRMTSRMTNRSSWFSTTYMPMVWQWPCYWTTCNPGARHPCLWLLWAVVSVFIELCQSAWTLYVLYPSRVSRFRLYQARHFVSVRSFVNRSKHGTWESADKKLARCETEDGSFGVADCSDCVPKASRIVVRWDCLYHLCLFVNLWSSRILRFHDSVTWEHAGLSMLVDLSSLKDNMAAILHDMVINGDIRGLQVGA